VLAYFIDIMIVRRIVTFCTSDGAASTVGESLWH